MKEGFGFTAYPGVAQPGQPLPYTQIDYPLQPVSYYQHQKQVSNT